MRSWVLVTCLAALFPGLERPTLGQQMPVTGPPNRSFSSFRPSDPLFRGYLENGKFRLVGARGQTLEAKTEIVLLLPPAPGLRDEGAIAAAIEIVVARNPVLSAGLSRIGRGQPSTLSAERRVPGELYLKIHKPASVNGHRQDFPADAFAASPMRRVAYPQFVAPSRR